MDDLLEASGDLVVADLALFAGHDFAELPDSLHRGAPLRRTVEASISLVDSSQPIRDRHRFLSRGRVARGPRPSPNRMMKCSILLVSKNDYKHPSTSAVS